MPTRVPLTNFTTRDLRGHRSKVNCVGFNADGGRLASGATDGLVHIWNAVNLEGKEYDMKGHTGNVVDLSWSPFDSMRLASGSADKDIRIWDYRTLRSTHRVNTGGENLNVCWSPDGRYLAAGNAKDVVTVIDGDSGVVFNRKQYDSEINEMAWTNDGRFLLLTTGLGTIQAVDWANGMATIATIDAHTGNIYAIEMDPRGRFFATGSSDGLVSLYDIEEYLCVRMFGRLEQPVRTIGFSYDGELIAAGSEDPFIDISIVETGEPVCRIETNKAISNIAWHPHKYMLAMTGDDQVPWVRLWAAPRDLGLGDKL